MGAVIKIKYLQYYLKMTDTPKYILEIQLKLWLEKTPGERLLQFLTDNDALYKAIQATKETIKHQVADGSK